MQRTAAYARIIRDGTILLTRISSHAHHTGHWTLPGGGVDHGENPRDTVLREVYEETGLRASVGAVLGVHDTHFVGTAPSGRVEDYHGIHLIFAATVRDDAPVRVVEENGTTDAAAWWPIATLEDQPVLDVVRFAVDLSPEPLPSEPLPPSDFLPPSSDFPPVRSSSASLGSPSENSSSM